MADNAGILERRRSSARVLGRMLLPSARVRGGLLIAAALLLIAFPLVSSSLYYQNMIIMSMLLAIMASSWNIISGYAGYISLGHSAFLGVGAYTVAILAVRTEASPFWFVPVGGLVSGLVAALIGVALLRTRGHAFVILTIALLFFFQLIVVLAAPITEGSTGISLPLPTWSIEFQNLPFYYAFAGLLGVTVASSWWIRRSKFGMGLTAIREDEDKAGTLGIRLPVYKLLAFVLSAVFIGMAGGIYAYYLTFIEPVSMFDIVISTQIVLAALLGGTGTLLGPVIGAFLLEPLFQITNTELGGGNWRLVLSGGLMALVAILLPRGIGPALRSVFVRTEGQRRAPADDTVPAPRAAKAPAPRRLVDETGRSTGGPLLEVTGLEKRFGGVSALSGCSFTVDEGSVTGLIGPNGSGKTTVFNLIGGTMGRDGGEIRFAGERIDRLPPWARSELGLARTFQITRLFGEMTVLENLVAPLRGFAWRLLAADAIQGAEAERAEELLEFVGLETFRDQPAHALSYGQQKLVEFAQVLMLDPRMILFDEPASGINPALVDRLAGLIQELNAQGKTFLIIEHDMSFVLGNCDPVYVLAGGTCISKGTPDAVTKDPQVLEVYLGQDFQAGEPMGRPKTC